MASKSPISLIPEMLDLKIYGGDGVKLRLTVTTPLGEPMDISGGIAAQIRTSRPNATIQADFGVDTADSTNGIVMLTLTGDQTADLHTNGTAPVERFVGVWDVQWTPEDDAEMPVTLVQGAVESSLDVTRLN